MADKGLEVLSSRAILGMYYERLEAGDLGWVGDVSFYAGSDQESETYNWLGMVPQMREWVGGRNAKELRAQGITIVNREFESTLQFKLKDMRRDKTPQIQVRIGEQVDRANSHWASLLTTLIINGEAAVCYDGQYFFDVDHSEGDSGAQSNDVTYTAGTAAAPTAAEMEGAIMAAIEKQFGYVDDQGEPINENARMFKVMVPVTFWKTAMTALNADVILESGAARTNLVPVARAVVNGFGIDLVVNPRLTWTTKFLVLRADGNLAPFIRQEEVPLEVSAVAEGSELEFNKREHHYGLYASRNVGYGMWQKAVLTTFTT